jgi:hypothetical protein
MSVVLAAQKYCLRRAKRASASDDKLYWLYTALYIVVCTMAFLRPNELTKVALNGMGGLVVGGVSGMGGSRRAGMSGMGGVGNAPPVVWGEFPEVSLR